MTIDIENAGADRDSLATAFEALALTDRPEGAVVNPFLRRALAKIGRVAEGEAGAHLAIHGFGDSIASVPFLLIANRLRAEYGNGGTGGRIQVENGWIPWGPQTVGATEIGPDHAASPIGYHWRIQPSQSLAARPDSGNLTDQFRSAPLGDKGLRLRGCVRVGIWYVERPGGGTFAVQKCNPYQLAPAWENVAGLTSVSTDGAGTAVRYVEAASLTAFDLHGIRINHVSGGDVHIVGAIATAASGVVNVSWTIGGSDMPTMLDGALWEDFAGLLAPDLVFTTALDDPAGGQTPAALVDDVMTRLRASLDNASTVPPNPSLWAGSVRTIAAQPPEFVWFTPNLTSEEATLTYDEQAAAIVERARELGDCAVDVQRMWPSWGQAYDLGAMSHSDTVRSIHPNVHFHALVASTFLAETRLLGNVYRRLPKDIELESLKVGSEPLGVNKPRNRVKFSQFDEQGFRHVAAFTGADGNIGYINGVATAYLASDEPLHGATLFMHSLASGGRLFAVNVTDYSISLSDAFTFGNWKTFLSFDMMGNCALGKEASLVTIGPKGTALSGVLSGTVTLAAGTATVTNGNLTANARVVLTRTARGGTPGIVYEVALAAGSFTVTARDAADQAASADTSTLAWVAVEA